MLTSYSGIGKIEFGDEGAAFVCKDEVDSTQAEAARIYRALADLAVPVDVVVVRTTYVERYGDLVGTLVHPALREGKVIYAR